MKKIKPGLATSYDLWPGNRTGSQKAIDKKVNK